MNDLQPAKDVVNAAKAALDGAQAFLKHSADDLNDARTSVSRLTAQVNRLQEYLDWLKHHLPSPHLPPHPHWF